MQIGMLFCCRKRWFNIYSSVWKR